MFIEVKCPKGWWVTIDTTITVGEIKRLRAWFNILSKDVLKGGVWKSTKQLTEQMLEYIDTYNKTRAKPFRLDLYRRRVEN